MIGFSRLMAIAATDRSIGRHLFFLSPFLLPIIARARARAHVFPRRI